MNEKVESMILLNSKPEFKAKPGEDLKTLREISTLWNDIIAILN